MTRFSDRPPPAVPVSPGILLAVEDARARLIRYGAPSARRGLQLVAHPAGPPPPASEIPTETPTRLDPPTSPSPWHRYPPDRDGGPGQASQLRTA